jgi:NADPH-dependent ferric siderophore reductase
MADETGVPALLAIIETLPAGHRAIALAEVADEGERQHVSSDADVELHRLTRGGSPPCTSDLMLATLEALELPAGPGQVWGGGESLVMRDLRRHLQVRRADAGTPMRVMGYWKHDRTPDWY